MKKSNTIIASVEGLMGSGKSTLLTQINKTLFVNRQKYSDNSGEYSLLDTIFTVEEPVSDFTSFGPGRKYNPLLLSYTKPAANSVPAQLHIMRSVFSNYRSVLKNLDEKEFRGLCVFERSPIACEIFIRTMKDARHLSNFGAAFLTHEYEIMMNMAPMHLPDFFIFLDADPDLCYERINKRGRKGENFITLSYLQDLKHNYDKFLSDCNRPVFKIRIHPFTTTKALVTQFNDCVVKYVYDQ